MGDDIKAQLEADASSNRPASPVYQAISTLLVAKLSPADVLGPGNEAAQALTQGRFGTWALFFPWARRYFWRRLCGLSGMVRSTSPDSRAAYR